MIFSRGIGFAAVAVAALGLGGLPCSANGAKAGHAGLPVLPAQTIRGGLAGVALNQPRSIAAAPSLLSGAVSLPPAGPAAGIASPAPAAAGRLNEWNAPVRPAEPLAENGGEARPSAERDASAAGSLEQLKEELARLQEYQRILRKNPGVIEQLAADHRGGQHEARALAAAAIKERLGETRAKLEAHPAWKRHQELGAEIGLARSERRSALLRAAAADSVAHEYAGRGGADEVRGRAYERAHAMEVRLRALRDERRAIEEANPSLQPLWKRVLRRYLGW